MNSIMQSLVLQKLNCILVVEETHQREDLLDRNLPRQFSCAEETSIEVPRHHTLIHVDLDPDDGLAFEDIDGGDGDVAATVVQDGPFAEVEA
jgi:hypothetical protein